MGSQQNDNRFKINFIRLFKIFNKYPYMFVSFLIRNDAFKDSFKKKLLTSKIKQKEHFVDMEKMLDYYVSILDNEQFNMEDQSASDKEKHWNNRLSKAISEQRFEDAAKIRDFMILKSYKILV